MLTPEIIVILFTRGLPYVLSKDDLNPFYFLSHTLALHSQLLHVLPLPRVNLCNAPL